MKTKIFVSRLRINNVLRGQKEKGNTIGNICFVHWTLLLPPGSDGLTTHRCHGRPRCRPRAPRPRGCNTCRWSPASGRSRPCRRRDRGSCGRSSFPPRRPHREAGWMLSSRTGPGNKGSYIRDQVKFIHEKQMLAIKRKCNIRRVSMGTFWFEPRFKLKVYPSQL